MSSPADIGTFTTDTDLVIRTWDDWMVDASGIAAAAAVGQPLTSVIPDLESRGLLQRFTEVASSGAVQVLAPALHHYLIPCPPRQPSGFDHMRQRVTIGPLRDEHCINGVMVAIEDVTERLEAERELATSIATNDAAALRDENWRVRHAAVHGLSQATDQGFITSLVERLKSDHRDFALLSSALKVLASTDVDITEPLATLLRDGEPDLRIQAALALGEQHDAAAIRALQSALRDADINVRFQAIESLGRLHAEAAVDELLDIALARDFFLSFAALDALTAINEPRVAPELAPLLADDQFRVPAADALGALGDDRAIRPLVAALNDSPVAVSSIVDAIAAIHDRFVRDYQDGARITDLVRFALEPQGRAAILAAIETVSDEQLPALIKIVGWLSGTDAAQALTQLLGRAAVRDEVVEALVRQGEEVIDLLLPQLQVEDRDQRHAAIVALGRLGSRRATAALAALLDPDSDLLVAVAGALARIGDAAAFRPLLDLLGHTDGAVRQSVIGALNSIGHPELPIHIASLLEDDQPLVRESAVRIAGYFGYPETVEQLFARAEDSDEGVRRAALEHLPFLDDPRVVTTLLAGLRHASHRVRASAARAMCRVDDDSVREGLAAALSDEAPWVRYFAARSLCEQRHAEALPALLELAADDPAPHVRIAAIDALAAIDDASAVSVLKQTTRDADADVAAAALSGLARIAAAEGLADLQNALRADLPSRRIAAVTALAAAATPDAVASLEWAAGADPDPAVMDAAIAALGTVAASGHSGSATAVEALTAMLSDSARREAAANTIAAVPPARLADIGRGLRHPHPEVRRNIVDVLGRFQRPEATELLAIALRDSAAAVRERAVSTLMRLGAHGMDQVLADLAATDPAKAVRRVAAAALARGRSQG